jgi:hypothetical protein
MQAGLNKALEPTASSFGFAYWRHWWVVPVSVRAHDAER